MAVNDLVQQLLGTLGTSVLLDDESAFDFATRCVHEWVVLFLASRSAELVHRQAVSKEQAKQLVLSNLQDYLASANHIPNMSLEMIGLSIATPIYKSVAQCSAR
ncbi:hypothetical protein [Pseudomonas sp. RA_105y_Pfl2_P56]|uniref:hypothetical protein n=1 Tax=Pseudomonas sp. RA_105y_Pfl2_P56 TaxID=3088701 RepID=UPI0030D899CB